MTGMAGGRRNTGACTAIHHTCSPGRPRPRIERLVLSSCCSQWREREASRRAQPPRRHAATGADARTIVPDLQRMAGRRSRSYGMRRLSVPSVVNCALTAAMEDTVSIPASQEVSVRRQMRGAGATLVFAPMHPGCAVTVVPLGMSARWRGGFIPASRVAVVAGTDRWSTGQQLPPAGADRPCCQTNTQRGW